MPTWVLDATTKVIEASMSGAPATTNPTWMSSYSDKTATTFTPGSTNGSLNGTTAVPLVGAPAASTQRIIKDITIHNADTAPATITLRIDVSATDYKLYVFTIAAGTTWTLADLPKSALILPGTATAFTLPVAIATNTIGELAAVGATGEYLAGVTGGIPAWATLNQAAVAGLTTANSPIFVTVKLSGLTDAYVPYHVSDATGLANSPIHTDGVSIGIGMTASSTSLVDLKSLGNDKWIFRGVTSGATVAIAGFYQRTDGSGSIGVFSTTGTQAVSLEGNTHSYFTGYNLGINTATPGGSGTAGTGVLSLGNGTAPVGGVANQVSLFSKDVTASAELFAMDEAGNTPQLTPHPADFLNILPLAGREYPWAYASENPYLGKRIRVDMMGAIREVERLSGKKFILLSDLPPEECLDWDEGQEAQWMLREQQIEAAQAQIIALNDQIAGEPDYAKVKELTATRDAMTVPAPYRKKAPPKWMKDRGVASSIVQ